MILYEEEWIITLLFRKDGSVFLRSSIYAIPSATIAVLLLYMDEWVPGFRENLGLDQAGQSTLWNASMLVLGILMSFRTKQAFARFWEGTGLLHQMRGEWFDTVSNCVTFSISSKKRMPELVTHFRHTLVRLMSLCHGSALEEIAGNSVQVHCIDCFGLDDGTLNHLNECHVTHGFNKVEVMLHLVQSLITWAHDNQVLNIPPPILSRVYQTISRGFVNLLNSKKIADTRFPFPYAQLISVMLNVQVFMCPIVISAQVQSKVLAAILTFLPIFGLFALNFIASELENPFGTDDNDLPLAHFQEEMNNCLLMLLHTNTDMIAGLSCRATLKFDDVVLMYHHGKLDTQQKKRLSQWEDQKQASHPVKPNPPPVKVEAAPPAPVPVQESLEARMAAVHPKLTQSINDFQKILHNWSGMLEGQVSQLHSTFDALKHINRAQLEGGGGGWEAAVSPAP